MEIYGIEIPTIVAAIFVTVISGLVLQWLRPKAKIIWAEPHQFTFLVRPPENQEPPTFNVNTRTLFVQNVGKQAAEGVELIFNWEPQTYNLWPILPHTTETMPDNRFVVRAHNLGPKEWFQIELLSVRDLPSTLRVRTKLGEGIPVLMAPMRVFPPWVRVFVLTLMSLGAFSIIYHLISWLASLQGS